MAKSVGHKEDIEQTFGLYRTFLLTSFLLPTGPFSLDDYIEVSSSLTSPKEAWFT